MPSRVIVSNPSALLTAFVARLKTIPALTAIVPPEYIIEYVEGENGDLTRTIAESRRSLLLAYLSSVSPAGNPALIRVQIGVAFRVADPMLTYITLLNGISTVAGSDQQPTITSTILSPWSPMQVPAFERRFIFLDSQRVFDYWEMHAAFTDRNS